MRFILLHFYLIFLLIRKFNLNATVTLKQNVLKYLISEIYNEK